jgi:FkbM family methyltransferase
MALTHALHPVKKALERHAPSVAHRLRCWKQLSWRLREPEMEILGPYIARDAMAVDVGANYGIFAEFLARYAQKVLAFEPLPDLARYLGRVLPANATVRNAALSDHEGKTVIRVPYGHGAVYESLATVEPGNALDGHAVREIPVALTRLDDCVTEKVGFIKIDVEGHELAVLRGAQRVLREDRPNLLIEIEDRHNSESFAGVAALLSPLGYRCFHYKGGQLHESALSGGGKDRAVPGVINYLFLNPGAAEQATC